MSDLDQTSSSRLAGQADRFRLGKILPGGDSDSIECSLSEHYISERSNDYTTVSYVWGSKDNPVLIYVDGKPVYIRRRLGNLLRQLRNQARGSAFEVWIDAICIRQDDPNDKALQIPMMSAIYTRAAKTIAWLDEADEEIHRAFDVIEKRAHQTREWYRVGNPVRTLTESEWTAVIKLAQHKHFTRRWIVQETMLPYNLVLQCGERTLPWTLVESFLSTCEQLEIENRWQQLDQSIFRRLWVDRCKLHEHHGGLRLPDLLWRYKDTVCKNECDKINAFLGLVEDGHELYCEEGSPRIYHLLSAV